MADTSFDPGEHIGESVTFQGTARTAAAGAIVSVGSGTPVYIEGLDSWDKDVEGKPVEVTGVLRLRESDMPSTPEGEAPLHGIDSETFVLDGADWVPADPD